jgi:hypothetical protein
MNSKPARTSDTAPSDSGATRFDLVHQRLRRITAQLDPGNTLRANNLVVPVS